MPLYLNVYSFLYICYAYIPIIYSLYIINCICIYICIWYCTQAWRESDAKVKALIETLTAAEERRAAILQEEIKLNYDSSTTAILPTTSSTTDTTTTAADTTTVLESQQQQEPQEAEVVVEAVRTTPGTSIQRFDPSIYKTISLSGGRSLVKIPSKEIKALVDGRSTEELAIIITNVLLLSLSSFVSLTAR